MRVVDEDEHGGLLGEVGQQRNKRDTDKKPITTSFSQSDRAAQGSCLQVWKAVDPAHDWPHQLLQRSERQRRLRLGARAPEDTHLGAVRCGCRQECALSDPRLAMDKKNPTASRAHIREHPADCVELWGASKKAGRHDSPS
jgi:hypothetical protein